LIFRNSTSIRRKAMKIFVGHSFDKKDSEVVNKFLEFFKSREDEGIKIITGERAQNKSVAEKVKTDISRSDAFAGIFTCERKINTCVNIFGSEKGYTTSNWVIQESGFALGKDKPLILIVERGIYKFPELQADLELVYFNRNNLEEPFVKLNQVIDSMLTKEKVITSVQISQMPADIEGKEKEDKDKIPIGKEGAFDKYSEALKSKDPSKIRNAYETILVPALSSDESEKLLWKGFTLRVAHHWGDLNAFNELVELAETNKDKPEVVKQLALKFQLMGEYEKAKDKYLEIKDLYDVKNEGDKAKIVDCYIEANKCVASQGKFDEAISSLSKLLLEDNFKEQKAQVLKGLAEISKDNKDMEKFFIYAEGCLDIDPTYTTLRFNLAYNYSQKGQHRLSFLHYYKLTDTVKEPLVFNNLGVQYQRFDIFGKSISNFNKAANLNVTLAMANLAQRYLQQGFIEDARKMIKRANDLSKDGIEVSGNVGYAKNELDGKVNEENEEERKILIEAEREREFRVKYTEAFVCDMTVQLNQFIGIWETPWGDMEILFNQDDNTFRAEKQTEVSERKKRVVSINGTIKNLSAVYNIKVVDTTAWSSGPAKDTFYEATGYMRMNIDNNRQIEVMEKTEKDEMSIINWRKK
jgi:tetratricopeptide (TPR) repeat protein